MESAVGLCTAMIADPALKSQQQVFGRVSSAFLPILRNRDIGFDQGLRQRDYLTVIRRETLFSRNLLQGWQYNFTRRGDQLVGGRDPPGGTRGLPACQREHCSTALAKSAEDNCRSTPCGEKDA